MKKKFICSLAILACAIGAQKIKTDAIFRGGPKLFNLHLDKVKNPGFYSSRKRRNPDPITKISPLVLDSTHGYDYLDPDIDFNIRPRFENTGENDIFVVTLRNRRRSDHTYKNHHPSPSTKLKGKSGTEEVRLTTPQSTVLHSGEKGTVPTTSASGSSNITLSGSEVTTSTRPKLSSPPIKPVSELVKLFEKLNKEGKK